MEFNVDETPVCLLIPENNENCRLQQTQKIWRKTGGSVNLSCIISVCSSDKIEYKWFVFKEDRHFALNSSGTYSLNAENLTIKSLNIADSGIYYCGTGKTKCCNPLVGLGTTLVVTGKSKTELFWERKELRSIFMEDFLIF